ncbi:uncharacterized protein DUF4249 [Lutibacter sp. Hel_I_33_5]|uniref:DUF4249 family protein n=1 Tax=Lutibacter sp. Hel_I_33_5 TaxID=1566289 RepID=UPI0011A691FC|nr:DUF4249 family protein [Lutibacter sp. Hel_I_33_5]TVZ55219.1 uncharacterized protein DUF4249 [Lutibacter sp. Hel_I_33_5]
MKKIYILPVLLMFIFSNCEKVIDVDVPSIQPKLIIDAAFDVYFDETPVTVNTTVKLKLSADYFEENIPTVTNATVFVTDLSSNTIINYSDINNDGDYEADVAFIPSENTEYELTVIYNNQTYKGKASRVKSSPINSIIQGDETLFTGKETQLKVDFTDVSDKEEFYLFNFTNNLMIALDDRFFNGSDYNFSYFYQEDDIELPADVTIRMSGMTKEYYTYFEVLINQSGQNSGGPFQTIPSSLLGNMINKTDEANFPLGYFHISETDTFDISLVDKSE